MTLRQNDKTGAKAQAADHTDVTSSISRRHFVQGAAVLAASGPLVRLAHAEAAAAADSLNGRIYKTLKIGMVRVGDSLTEKFKAAKEAGFVGIEMNSPGMDVEATKVAIQESGLPVDGTVCSTHWGEHRHTNPDPAARAAALADLQSALRDTKSVGGHSVLLVAGHGNDGPESEIWPRAIDNIRKAIPLAAELGVQILIENVWNRFCYVHDGPQDQTAEKYVKFIDELNSPWVGMQFDIGNHWKYGNMGDWIRQLGRRVYKLDVKGYSRAKQDWTNIGEGDIDFEDVRRALIEIDFYGWCAAEIGGGDLNRLKEISANMDKVFALG